MRRPPNLDPVRDHEAIVKHLVVYSRSFDFVRSIEIALLKTFAIPAIAEILVNSGEFLNRTQKRYDDTDLLLSHFIEHGYSSKVGMQAIRKINRMHARHPITNEQMLYVLATFVVEPILWMEKFTHRPLDSVEKEALFQFWLAVGKRMGIQDLFSSLTAAIAYHEAYEQKFMVYSPNNARLYHGVLPVVARMMPWPLSKLVAPLMTTLMSERLVRAFNLEPGSSWFKKLVRSILRLRASTARALPTPAVYRTLMRRPTYPDGHDIKQLGV